MTPAHITMMQERGIHGMAAFLCVHTMLQAFGGLKVLPACAGRSLDVLLAGATLRVLPRAAIHSPLL